MRHTEEPYADQLPELLATGDAVPIQWDSPGARIGVSAQAPQEAFRILRLQDRGSNQNTSFALDVLEGLSKKPKSIPSMYFYDAAGSQLFKRITQLDEYYLTRCEYEVLYNNLHEFDHFGEEPFNLVELGVGDGHKTRLLLEHFSERFFDFVFVPVDVSEDAITDAIDELRKHDATRDSGGALRVKGLIGEYSDAINWLENLDHRRNLVLFLGSSIGNFEPPECRRFLRHLWSALRHDDCVLIGFDLRKDIDVIMCAYNDALGVTREFNLNLLDRMNRELGANFSRNAFEFYTQYEVETGVVQSWLLSTRAQEVYVGSIQKSFSFDAWEGIYTECSCKYSETEIARMAEDTGFVVEEFFYDSRRYFVDSLWRVRKS